MDKNVLHNLLRDQSNSRRYYHEKVLPKFISLLAPESYIIDVGKSQTWGEMYEEWFKGFKYVTIDKDKRPNPDIIQDFENTDMLSDSVDGIVVMGSWEQTDNPFKLLESVTRVLKKGGLFLAGIVSVGFPLYAKGGHTDFLRFTPNGGKRFLRNFQTLESHIVGDPEHPEYLFYICKKP